MRRTRTVVLAFALATLVAAIQPRVGAQALSVSGSANIQTGITGAWDIQVNAPDTPVAALYAELTQKEGIVTGSFSNAQDETKATGTMSGNTLKIDVYLGGVFMTLTGELKGDSLSGKALIRSLGEVDWTGKRAE